MALFEVWLGNIPKMYTNCENCIPDIATQRSMKDAGYTIKYNGKKLGKNEYAEQSKKNASTR